MTIIINTLTPEQFLNLYASVGWEPPCIEQVKRALANTMATFVAIEDERPVGMVRLLGDGGMSFYLKDFAVDPNYQQRGVGQALMQTAQKFITDQIEENWAVSLELISTREAVPFYKRHGFEERPCAYDGPGMFKMIRKGR